MKSENKIQSDCVKWIWNSYPQTRGLFFEINNNPKNAIDGARRKAAGMIAGVADTCFLWDGKAYFIEFKAGQGRQRGEQFDWEITILKAGFDYYIIKTLNEFQALIKNIMKL